MLRLVTFFFILSIVSCATVKKQNLTVEQKIINDAINAHGGELYDKAHYSFQFRGGAYSFKQEDAKYEYTYEQTKNNRTIYSKLNNAEFIRSLNGEFQNLSDKDKVRYGNSLNSVIYFALLPYRLNDPAVVKKNKGNTTIKDQPYHVIEVRFTEEKGGTDHDDIFYYWINTKTKTMDYLAYEFHVNGGGIRFRSAYNPRVVEGIRFQDYENYSAPSGTSMESLPKLYEQGSLKLLSKIELEEVKNIE